MSPEFEITIFSAQKDKIDHNFPESTILDIGRLILDTLQYCEKYRDLGFRSILDTIFSRLYTIVLFHKMYVNVCMYVQVREFDFYKGKVCHPQKSMDAKKKTII